MKVLELIRRARAQLRVESQQIEAADADFVRRHRLATLLLLFGLPILLGNVMLFNGEPPHLVLPLMVGLVGVNLGLTALIECHRLRAEMSSLSRTP